MPDIEYLTAREVEAVLKVSPTTLWRLVKTSQLSRPLYAGNKRVWPAEAVYAARDKRLVTEVPEFYDHLPEARKARSQ